MIYIERDMFIAYMYILDHITCQNSLLYQNIVIVLDTLYILLKATYQKRRSSTECYVKSYRFLKMSTKKVVPFLTALILFSMRQQLYLDLFE